MLDTGSKASIPTTGKDKIERVLDSLSVHPSREASLNTLLLKADNHMSFPLHEGSGRRGRGLRLSLLYDRK